MNAAPSWEVCDASDRDTAREDRRIRGLSGARRVRAERLQRQVEANLSDLLAYAERRSANQTDAADALGDALEIIWKRALRVPADDTEARMYMFVVVRNVLANGLRARHARSVATQRLAQVMASQPAAQADSARQSDLSLDVARALSMLPPAQAELVRPVHWDGFTIAEAGKIMGVGASTARGRYATARSRLRTALEQAAAFSGTPAAPRL